MGKAKLISKGVNEIVKWLTRSGSERSVTKFEKEVAKWILNGALGPNGSKILKNLKSAGSKRLLEWMKNNADKATRILASGNKEFGGRSNREALALAKLNAYKELGFKPKELSSNASRLAKLGTAAGTIVAVGYPLTSEPAQQYIFDLWLNNIGRPHLGLETRTLTNDNYQQSYLDDYNRIMQAAYRLYVRTHGYPKPGQTINLPINPSVFKELNESGKYAEFTIPNILKAAFRGNNLFEFTDGGMSGSARINPETGELEIISTDKISWKADSEKQRNNWKNGDLGGRIRYFMDQYGSNDENGDKITLTTIIPADTISGEFKGKLRDIPVYKSKK